MPDAGDCLLLEAVFQFGRGLQQAARAKQQESDYMKAVAKIIDMIFKAVEWVITALVALMSALVLLQIINRAILNTSLTWSEEIVNYSMIWIAMLGSCLLVRNNGHMAVDNFLKMLRGVPKAIATFVSVALQVAFIVVMFWGILEFLPSAAQQFSPVLRLDMAMIYSIFLISGVLMLLGLIDYWIIHRGKIAAYSEEDELLKKVQEESTVDKEEA